MEIFREKRHSEILVREKIPSVPQNSAPGLRHCLWNWPPTSKSQSVLYVYLIGGVHKFCHICRDMFDNNTWLGPGGLVIVAERVGADVGYGGRNTLITWNEYVLLLMLINFIL